jgi:hypothetical protein
MSTFAARDLINADRWSRLFFTTYALSLSFFEAVVLDAIVRRQIDSSLILADVTGVRAAMGELGAQSVGRAYDVEPVFVSGGCFHPKLLCVTSKDDAHLVIGSGNLTFGGWGSNLECVEHLHPSFAADAFTDAAEFLHQIVSSPRIKHGAGESCIELADELASRVRDLPKTGSIRLIHNLVRSIPEQLASFVAELGGATQLVIASPFFDGLGVERLCEQLGVGQAHVHVHNAGTLIGSAGTNWPSAKAELRTTAVSINFLQEETNRLLHAKLYEVMCRRGRVVLSGSSNATLAGLESDRNVELCVVRIQREALVGWSFVPSQPPVRTVEDEEIEEDENEHTAAVLRASLQAGILNGQVVSNYPHGQASVLRKTALLWLNIGTTEISFDGRFALRFDDAWEYNGGGQFLLRLESSSGQIAQGFVALPELREIARRLGVSAQNFFSLLQSKETAADVAAIMEFIRLHPDWLPRRETRGEGRSTKPRLDGTQVVDIDNLIRSGQPARLPHTNGSAAWSTEARFMQDVFAAFQQRRGPIDATATIREPDGADEAGDTDASEVSKGAAKDTAKALASFERLLDHLLHSDEEHRQSLRALQIAQYVCERLEVESFQTVGYMDRILHSFTPASVTDEVREAFGALALLWSSQINGGLSQKSSLLRRQLLRVSNLFPDTVPRLELVDGFRSCLISDLDAGALWESARSVRTIQEEMKSFWSSASGVLSREAFPHLSNLPEWSTLQLGCSPRVLRMHRYSEYCPHCWIALSGIDAARLRNTGITTCPRGRILLCEEY